MGYLIRKASGDFEEYRPEKIRRAILRSGASEDVANEILAELDERLYDGISTKEIFHFVHQLLHKRKPSLASRYDLKGAIMRLGPEGYAFETYLAEILREYGYKTKVRQLIQGVCVMHEVDVVAEGPDNKVSAIECKYHNSKGMTTGLKEAMYTYARFLDLNEGYAQGHGQHFDDIWLVTNTKFSPEAIDYAKCKQLRLLGWRYPPEKTLENMIESKGLYPITILKSVDNYSRQRIFDAGMVLAKDLLTNEFSLLLKKTGLSSNRLRAIVDEAKEFYEDIR